MQKARPDPSNTLEGEDFLNLLPLGRIVGVAVKLFTLFPSPTLSSRERKKKRNGKVIPQGRGERKRGEEDVPQRKKGKSKT